MNYEIIEIDGLGGIQEHVIIDRGDGSFESFPADAENPRYQGFLKALEGNEPEVIEA